jgi:hypothetical protein
MKTYGGVDVYIRICLTSALIVGEWSASRLGRFTPGERAPGTHWTGGWVGPRAGLNDVRNRKLLTLPEMYYILLLFFQSNTTIYQSTRWHFAVNNLSLLVVQCRYMFRLMKSLSGDTPTNPVLLNYASYMDPYIVFIIVRYNNLKKYGVLLSLSIITFICTDWVVVFYTALKIY